MLSKAQAKFVRMSPRKARLVCDLVKGKSLEDAEFILQSANKGPAAHIKKVMASAFANANFERKAKLLAKDVVISQIRVDGGPTMRRYRAATMGRASIIRHRTSHIYMELEQLKDNEKAKEVKE